MSARIGVLISGRGSNMLALAGAARAAPEFEIALVLSNEPDAPGLAAAEALGAPTAIVDHRRFPRDKAAFEAAMTETLLAARCDVLCLAGFMRILSPAFLTGPWAERILNIHPSLLPAFRGLDTHARALAAGAKIHGATVHLVRAEVDDGPILAQAALAVRLDETPDALAARVLALEHALYPAALRAFLSPPGAAESAESSKEPPLFSPPLTS
ncbi:MAG: phosphoribosylglycinamide formyltransferase [Pseudomonadota bacterium]